MYQSKIITTYMERIKQVIDDEFPLMVNCPKCEHDIEPAALMIAQNKVRELLLDSFQDFLVDLHIELARAVGSAVGNAFELSDDED